MHWQHLFNNKIPSIKDIPCNIKDILNVDEINALRYKIIKRNTKIFGHNKSHKLDRALYNRIFLDKPRHSLKKSYLYTKYMRGIRSSEILDAFAPKRNEEWIRGHERNKVIDKPIECKNFSFIDEPEKTLKLFKTLIEYESYISEATMNFCDDEILDVAPYMLLGLAQREMYPFLKNGLIKNGIVPVIERMGLDKFMDVNIQGPRVDQNIHALSLSYKPRRELAAKEITTIEVEITRLGNTINKWLAQLECPMSLNDTGISNVHTFASEILDNAQRHSIDGLEGDWCLAGFMKHDNGKFSCNLSFLNTGKTIYESITDTTNADVKRRLEQYTAKHKNISKSILSTIYAIQDGSTRENYKGSRGGIGMMKFISFINDIGQTETDNKPLITIISGNVCVHFNSQYGNAIKLANGNNIQWFNEKQSPDYAPDSKNAFLLTNRFPGTIITTRFFLDNNALVRKSNGRN